MLYPLSYEGGGRPAGGYAIRSGAEVGLYSVCAQGPEHARTWPRARTGNAGGMIRRYRVSPPAFPTGRASHGRCLRGAPQTVALCNSCH